MPALTKKYISDHLVGTHSEESWAKAVTEMVLHAAISELGDKNAEEVTIDAKFHVRPVDLEAVGSNGSTVRYHCIQVCVVVSPTGHEICFHKSLIK